MCLNPFIPENQTKISTKDSKQNNTVNCKYANILHTKTGKRNKFISYFGCSKNYQKYIHLLEFPGP